jgi:hypothetical protein
MRQKAIDDLARALPKIKYHAKLIERFSRLRTAYWYLHKATLTDRDAYRLHGYGYARMAERRSHFLAEHKRQYQDAMAAAEAALRVLTDGKDGSAVRWWLTDN